MKARGGAGRGAGNPGRDDARRRLEALFARMNRLTPDELARIGLVCTAPAELVIARASVAAAAQSSGRSSLLAEARARAREALLARYSQGGLHPTWLALNWGISQGTAEDRVAIIDALEDAAAATVVEDLVSHDVVDTLTADAEQVLGLAAGEASEGALAHALAVPDGDYRPGLARRGGLVLAGVVAGLFLASVSGAAIGVFLGVAAAAAARRRTWGADEPDAP